MREAIAVEKCLTRDLLPPGGRTGGRVLPINDDAAKAHLYDYLKHEREAVLAKLDGLSEYDVRRPLTVTETNLLGLVKHLAWVELGYLGQCLGRPLVGPWPWEPAEGEGEVEGQGEPAWDEGLTALWARADESGEEIVDGYRQVWAHGDTAILTLPLTTTAEIPPRSDATPHCTPC